MKMGCMKEVNPEDHPGVYFGTPFVYDERDFGCDKLCPIREECKKKAPKLRRRKESYAVKQKTNLELGGRIS